METELERMYVRLMGDSTGLVTASKEAEDAVREVNAMMAKHNQTLEEGKRVAQTVETATERYGRELSHLDDVLRQGAIDQTTYGRAAQKAQEDMAKAGREAGPLEKLTQQVKDLVLAWAAWSTVKEAFSWLTDGIHKVAEVGRQAERFGISTEKLSAIQFAAGREAGTWESALRHLNMQLGASALAGEKAHDVFSKMGLSGSALSAMGSDKSLDVLANKFREMGDSAESSALAQRLFGREAAMLLPTLRQGAEGFKRAAEEAKRLGWSVDAIQATKALWAEEAMDKLAKAFEGLQRTAAAEFAPLLADIADTITGWIEKLGGGREMFKQMAEGAKTFILNVIGGVGAVAVFIAGIAEQVKHIVDSLPGQQKKPEERTWWDNVDKAGKDILHGVGIGHADAPDSWAAKTQGVVDDVEKRVKGTGGLVAVMDDLAKRMDDLGKPHAIDKDKAMKDMVENANKYILKLNEEAEALESGQKGIERAKFAHDGLTAAKLAEIDAAQQHIDAIKEEQEAMRKSNEAVKKIIDESRSPLDKFKEEFKDLQGYFNAGQLTAGQYAAAVAKDFEAISKKVEEIKHPGAVTFGSREAYTAIVRSEDRGKVDVQSQIKNTLERIEKQTALTAKSNAEMADSIRGLVKAD